MNKDKQNLKESIVVENDKVMVNYTIKMVIFMREYFQMIELMDKGL